MICNIIILRVNVQPTAMVIWGRETLGLKSCEKLATSGKHVYKIYTPSNPTFIYKNGGLQDIHVLIFAPKHRLWVLVKTGI